MATGHPRALVVIADGSEEIEFVCTVDTLARGGVDVTTAAVGTGDRRQVECSRGVAIVAQAVIDDVRDEEFDLIALPGGMPGAKHLRDNGTLVAMLKQQAAAGKLIGAICAAPSVVLKHHGLLPDGPATCHPNFHDTMPNLSTERVVVSGNVVTSQGPATAIEFALHLLACLVSDAKAHKVAAPMIMAPGCDLPTAE